MTQRTYWLDGELRDWNDSPMGFMTHALHYGTGVFEGIRAYPGQRGAQVFRLQDHLDRMQRGAQALGMDLDTEALVEVTHDLLQRNRLTSAYVRPIAFYAGGGLHLDINGLELRVAVAVMPWTSHLGGDADDVGVSLRISPLRRVRASALPPLKLTGVYANSIIAKLEARRSGFEEALFVDDDGFVVEATGENVFCVFGDRVVAVEHPDALAGITRDTVISLSGAVSRPVHLAELQEADEIFLTGTSAEVAPVTRLDSLRTLPIGRTTRALQALYQRVVHGREAQRWSA